MNNNTEESKYSYDIGVRPLKVNLKENYKYYNRNIIFLFFQQIFVVFTIFLTYIYSFFIGARVKGKKNLKGLKGAVIVSNHVYQFDAFLSTAFLFPKRLYITMLQSNMGFPLISQYIRMCGAVPIPESRTKFRLYEKQTIDILNKDKRLLFYAEANLIPFCNHLRPFKKGGFKYATITQKPILPIVYTYRKPKGIFKFKKKPFLTLNILPPIYPNKTDDIRMETNNLLDKTYNTMNDFFINNSYIKND